MGWIQAILKWASCLKILKLQMCYLEWKPNKGKALKASHFAWIFHIRDA